MLTILKNLIKTNSENPPCHCMQILKYVGNFLKKNTNAKVIYQSVSENKGNVVAIFGKPNLLLNAHLDTVPASDRWDTNPFILKQNKNRLYGLGATDVKGAVASILCAVRKCVPKNILLLFNCDEEHGNSECVMAFLKSRLTRGLRYAIVTEPTNSNVVTMHKGDYTFEISFFGKSVHSAKPEKGINAIERAAGFVGILNAYRDKLDKRCYRGLKRSSLNVGVIRGGVKPNMVPDECHILIDRRVLPGKDYESAPGELKDLLQRYDTTAEIRTTFNAPCFEAKRNTLPVQILKRCGALQYRCAVDYWTEAPLFSRAGISSVVFGPGNMLQAHTANEFITIEDLEKTKEIYTKLFSMV